MELSEIGSVFESQLAGEMMSPILSLEQVKNLAFLTPGTIGDKNMTIQQILDKQEAILQQDMSNFRKKVCKKGFDILHKESGVQDGHARVISLMVDRMVKSRYPDEKERYIKVIKKIYRSIRVKQPYSL